MLVRGKCIKVGKTKNRMVKHIVFVFFKDCKLHFTQSDTNDTNECKNGQIYAFNIIIQKFQSMIASDFIIHHNDV